MATQTREDRLLIACSRVDPSAAVLEEIRSLASAIDWTVIAEVANRHFILPLVVFNLLRANAAIPGHLRDAWEELPAITTRDNLALLGQLDGLLRLCDAAGIPVLTWKGPVFVATGYGSLAARNCSDIDLLVPRQHIDAVQRLLLAQGYRQQRHALERITARFWHEFVFLPPTPGLGPVEVHPDLAGYPFVAQPAFPDLLARATPVTVAGRSIRTLCPEDMLLAMILHGAHHWWMWLRMLADIDASVRAVADWDAVRERARTIGLVRLLHMALLLAHDVLDSPVPSDVLQRARDDRRARLLCAYVAPRLVRPTAVHRYQGDFMGFLMHDRLIDSLRHTYRLFIWRDIVYPLERRMVASPPQPPEPVVRVAPLTRPPELVIGVPSAAGNTARREAVLATWGRDAMAHGAIDLVFLIGDASLTAPRREGHLLFLPCPDTYRSLPQKTRWFCRWALDHSPAPWLFKCDDDTYVRIDRLMAALHANTWSAAVVGCADGKGDHFHGGAGYLIRRLAAEAIATRLTAKKGLEDWKARDAIADGGLWFDHDERFSFDMSRQPEPDNAVISCHYATPELMRAVHDRFARGVAAG